MDKLGGVHSVMGKLGGVHSVMGKGKTIPWH
jgi:hypothetical protein